MIDQTYIDQTYIDQTYIDQTYIDQTYIDQTYIDQTYLSGDNAKNHMVAACCLQDTSKQDRQLSRCKLHSVISGTSQTLEY